MFPPGWIIFWQCPLLMEKSLAGCDIMPGKSLSSLKNKLLPSTLNMEAGPSSCIKNVSLIKKTMILHISPSFHTRFACIWVYFSAFTLYINPLYFNFTFGPPICDVFNITVLTHKAVLLYPIHNTTHAYCTILLLPSLWHVYFLFLHHHIVTTKSINLLHVVNAIHNESQYFFYRICKTISRKQVLHIERHFYFEYVSALKSTKGMYKISYIQSG